VFAVDHLPGEDHTIDRPALYDEFRGSFHYATAGSATGKHLFPEPSTALFSDWMFRRVLYAGHFKRGFMPSDVTLFNAMNDYPDGPIVEVSDDEAKQHLYRARQRSLSVLYWLQTEAPHWRGSGRGYPGLRLRPDVVGTPDGLAKAPYIRESRRIKADFTVLEQHVSAEVRDEAGLLGAERFPDSVGIGRYSVDIHLSTPAARGGRPEASRVRVTSRPAGESRPRAWPFQIPLGALLPVRVENLLPACKNLGVTHITNGCYRLHPIEWNIGEAAGALVAFCLERGTTPRQVRADAERLADYQYLLEQLGVELAWPDLSAAGSYNQWANKRRRHSWGEVDDELPFWATEARP
jgi:hypothetical protein